MAVTSPLTKTNLRIIQPCEDYAQFHKHKKYDPSFKGIPYLFSPIVFETLGAINLEGANVLSQVFVGLTVWVASSALTVAEVGLVFRATSSGQSLKQSSIALTAE